MPHTYWDHLPTTAFEAIDKNKTIIILPVGSIEQHGPHLPVSVDTRLVEGVLKDVISKIPDTLNIISLPTIPIGKANEHTSFDGTLCLSVKTLISLWTDIAESVFRTGFRKLLIMNAHGGQTQVTEIVARDLRVRHNALVVPINWWSVRNKPTEFSEQEYTYGIHGGAEETSMMMHLHPELVIEQERRNFPTNPLLLKDKYPRLFSQGVRHAWKAEDLQESGAMGDASIATAAAGKKIIEDASTSIVELLAEMSEFELPKR